MNIKRIIVSGDIFLRYALGECKKILGEYTSAEILVTEASAADSTANIVLKCDASLAPESYVLQGDGQSLTVMGEGPSAVLCGVYEAFGEAGVFFDANGYSVPHRFDLQAMLSLNKTVQPKCRLRGIRQHINFPMDISSYPLRDAKEYIRNLARMRFNAITFHSYVGQWHALDPQDPESFAGHFFYGQRHPIPKDKEIAEKIDNRKVFCIPEAEAIYDNPKECSEYAQYWLRELMETAKEAYLTITLSVEPPFDDIDKLVCMLKAVCKAYPQIDTLEILSFENSESEYVYGPLDTNDRLKEMLPQLCGATLPEVTKYMLGSQAFDENGVLEGYEGEPEAHLCRGYIGALQCLKRMLAAFERREEWLGNDGKRRNLRGGMYMTGPQILKILLPIMRRVMPQDITMSFLAGHASIAVSNSVEAMGMNGADWQKTMLYSWAEFDGNMYLQQLETEGLWSVLQQTGTDSIYGICVNHWRTAENKVCLCYAAQAFITPLEPVEFFRDYAEKIGIEAKDGFAETMERMSKFNVFCRDHLFNAAFCFVACWINPNGLTGSRVHKKENLEKAIAEYQALSISFQEILLTTETKEGIRELRLLINRCQCSVLLLKGLAELAAVRPIMRRCEKAYDQEGKLPVLTPEEVKELDTAYRLAQQYVAEFTLWYCENLPDRGSEGLVVSFVETLPVYLNELFRHYLPHVEQTVREDSYDAPPVPQSNG